jgi:hypothetical protein
VLRLDLHVHTTHSHDGFCSVSGAIQAAKIKGLDGIAITDHDSITGNLEAAKIAPKDFLIIPGIEVSSKDGHIVGLGIKKPIQQGLPAAETVKLIKEQGGIAVAAHPFGLSLKPLSALRAKFDAIEVFSPRRYLGNRLARRFAERNRLPMVAGSDAHFLDEVGLAGIAVKCKPKVNDILEAIVGGGTSIFGQALPPLEHLRKALHKLSRRVRRI